MRGIQLLSFDGRMRRSQWWIVQVGLLLGPGLAFFLAVYIFSGVDGENLAVQVLVSILGLGVIGGMLWVNLATSAQRFHDQGRSGWFYLLSLIPGIGSFITLAMLGFLDSARGTNRFGASAKYATLEADTFD